MTAYLLPQPQQFFDNNGDPLSGGLIYTCVVGASGITPGYLKDSYTDYSGTVLNSNPIVLDSSGRASIWGGDSQYKLFVFNSNKVLIDTIDNVSPILGTGPSSATDLINARIGSSGPASYRNKLGNCSFLINQLGTSFTLQPGDYLSATSDLWGVQNTTDKPIVVTISSDSWMSWEGRKINLICFTAYAQPTSGSVLMFQRIENCNTLAGKAACLSYLAVSPSTGVPVSAIWSQNFGSGGSSSVYGSFSPTNIPTSGIIRYSATTKISNTGATTVGTGNYLQITLDIPIRSTTPFFIGLPQLEEGSNPSPIEFVEDWVDWARCRRRYYAFSGVALVGSTDSASSSSRFLTIPFPTLMRVAPTVTATGNYTWSSQGTFGSFVQLVCSPGNTSSQATLTSLIADARL